MGIKQVQCVTVACDECGEDYGHDYTVHFDTLNDARESLKDRDYDGFTWFLDGPVICAKCQRSALAAKHTAFDSHEWEYRPGSLWHDTDPPHETSPTRACLCGEYDVLTPEQYRQMAPPDAPTHPQDHYRRRLQPVPEGPAS